MSALWQNAAAGMSEDEILTAFPQATTSKNTETLASGAVSKLEISNYVVSSRNFIVRFFFYKNSLEQIVLSCSDLKENDGENRALFGKLADLLSAKYGRPIAEQESDFDAFLTNFTKDWLSDGVKIMLVFMSLKGDSPVLNINYQARRQEDVEKL